MISTTRIWQLLETVSDPEIPVLSVVDLGVVRAVTPTDDGVQVVITPTYSGCPAMNVMAREIEAALRAEGIRAEVQTVLSPAWTTDWLSGAGRDKLRAYGIAPPEAATHDRTALFPEDRKVPCPRCGTRHTELVSEFGSTACKSLYRCKDCLEPFDYFKCH